eukprot:GHVN01008050.1.p1 GENE.GHVN01008050.1~~GHVN01008050.1.p1  ORF type:complete len:103 (-),score=4.88 GHVN01008050.1:1446-1754(-)
MSRTCVSLGFKLISHRSHHEEILFRYSCTRSTSAQFRMTLISFMLSTNWEASPLSSRQRSDTYMMNNRGPKTDPCATDEVTSSQSENARSTLTRCLRNPSTR